MIRTALIKRKLGPKSVRWRKHDTSRIEGLTDSVFAFAVTLTVVSLEVPDTFRELLYNMRTIAGFAICFAMIMLIWFDQYIFFRKYGLDDLRTIVLNSMLLFVILFYVYPLKFLFTFLTTGNRVILPDGQSVSRFTSNQEIELLMIIYGVGFTLVYGIFFLMHTHALRKREELELNAPEIFNTHTARFANLSMMAIGTLSFTIAAAGYIRDIPLSFYSGMCYGLIGPVLSILYSRRMKMLKRKFSKEEVDALANDMLNLENKNSN